MSAGSYPSAAAQPQSQPQPHLNQILYGDYDNIFNAQRYFSVDKSTAHLFDVVSGNGMMRSNVGGDELVEIVKTDPPGSYDTRVIFVDCVPKDKDRLSLISAHLRSIFNTFDISPRFAGYISRQHMPGSATRLDLATSKPHQHELWYSAVLRSSSLYGDESAPDLSRKVADWTRFCLWSKYDLFTKRLHVVTLGCPPAMREHFQSIFQGENGLQLQRHPMIFHAHFARAAMLQTHDFSGKLSEPLYENASEFRIRQLNSANDYTERVQTFLTLSRQIQQISTDYTILDAAFEHLIKEHEWFEENVFSNPISGAATAFSPSNETELRATLGETFESFLRESKLTRTYNNLYMERSKIGVSEGFAMVNQRDAEVNLKMAAESTQIARASHQDSRALRIIQILGTLFLPASLVSSIFGMGFFNTSQGTDGQAILTISGNWWWYIAICIPLTVLCLLVMGYFSIATKLKARRNPPLDMEMASLSQLKSE
ncbi:MAG: hypothetical protein ALECFALPRED_003648 [Alectoria fallacina]|uniref:Uncharacterized protein n=1 Tax=Alectoria fallacina TaxID=1903189 RepID=A0A8H3FTU4_9LECA|nr:MAG: hypothetical protein ALECFALPRED_003648 [Alectoria fallacina]